MSNKGLTIVNVLMAILVIFLLCVLVFKSCNREPIDGGTEIHTDTVYLSSTDTLYVPKDSIRYVEKIVLDTIFLKDTIFIREQKTYRDSISTIWISGINPELDSIRYFLPKDCVIITNTIKETIVKKKHWSQFVGVGLSGGYGVSINQTPTFSPFVGVTVTYGFGYTW